MLYTIFRIRENARFIGTPVCWEEPRHRDKVFRGDSELGECISDMSAFHCMFTTICSISTSFSSSPLSPRPFLFVPSKNSHVSPAFPDAIVWKSSGPMKGKYSVERICLIGNNRVLQCKNGMSLPRKLSRNTVCTWISLEKQQTARDTRR